MTRCRARAIALPHGGMHCRECLRAGHTACASHASPIHRACSRAGRLFACRRRGQNQPRSNAGPCSLSARRARSACRHGSLWTDAVFLRRPRSASRHVAYLHSARGQWRRADSNDHAGPGKPWVRRQTHRSRSLSKSRRTRAVSAASLSTWRQLPAPQPAACCASLRRCSCRSFPI